MREKRECMQRIGLNFFIAFFCLGLFCSCSKSNCNVSMQSRQVCLPPLISNSLPEPVCDQQIKPPPFKLQKVIVIDPGHGGEDLGTQSTGKPRYKEKHLNLTTAKMLETYLQQMGYKTIMTRSNDTFLTLEKRAEIANKVKCDLFISVHYNSAPAKQAYGVEVFFYRDDPNKSRVVSSKKLAQLVLNYVIENTQARSRGIKHGDLSVIRNTNMPAILIEGGFLTNDEEMQKLKDPSYLKRIAWGIAKGIQSYLN